MKENMNVKNVVELEMRTALLFAAAVRSFIVIRSGKAATG